MRSDSFRGRFARFNNVESVAGEGFCQRDSRKAVIVNDEQCFRHVLSMLCKPGAEVEKKRG